MDLFVERRESEKIIGNIYKGRVANVLPGMSSAFVDAGLDKNAYLFIDDVISVEHQDKKIEKMIKKGDEISIQIDKEPISTKGAKATMDIFPAGAAACLHALPHTMSASRRISIRGRKGTG